MPEIKTNSIVNDNTFDSSIFENLFKPIPRIKNGKRYRYPKKLKKLVNSGINKNMPQTTANEINHFNGVSSNLKYSRNVIERKIRKIDCRNQNWSNGKK
jgi:hypothetical protein